MDLDLHIIYSSRKEKQGTRSEPDTEINESLQFPSSGWGTLLEKMPMFTRIQMNRHIKSGKAIANVDHHTVRTELVKARRFLDEYLEDIKCVTDS